MSGLPDPQRLGGLEWTRRTRGILTRRERLRLLGAVVAAQRSYLVHRLRRDGPRAVPRTADRDVLPPDGPFAREVEAAAAEQSDVIRRHGYRTWVFARALADIDGLEVDEELLFAGCLLHDHGLEPSVPGEDFTLRSARRAAACATAAGVGDDRVTALADALTVHTTPGITVERDGALGCSIQSGAMVDIMGLRVWDLSAHRVDDTLARYPRGGFVRGLGGGFVAEAEALPGGRFGLLRRCGFVPLMRVAPFGREHR